MQVIADKEIKNPQSKPLPELRILPDIWNKPYFSPFNRCLFVNVDNSVLAATETDLFSVLNGVDAMAALDAFFH